jgi:Rad3-related DNA helicase
MYCLVVCLHNAKFEKGALVWLHLTPTDLNNPVFITFADVLMLSLKCRHNIDNVCIESMSVNIQQNHLTNATRNIRELETKVAQLKKDDESRLQEEYSRLVQGLRTARESQITDDHMANPTLSAEVLEEAVPGNIRKAEHFVLFLRRFVEYLKTRLSISHVENQSPVRGCFVG